MSRRVVVRVVVVAFRACWVRVLMTLRARMPAMSRRRRRVIFRCDKCGLVTRDPGFAARHEGVRKGHNMIPEEDG